MNRHSIQQDRSPSKPADGKHYKSLQEAMAAKPACGGKGRWVLSDDEMSLDWLPEGEEFEPTPVGGWDPPGHYSP